MTDDAIAATIVIEPDDDTLLWTARNVDGQLLGFGTIDAGPQLVDRVVEAAGRSGVVVRDETAVEERT